MGLKKMIRKLNEVFAEAEKEQEEHLLRLKKFRKKLGKKNVDTVIKLRRKSRV